MRHRASPLAAALFLVLAGPTASPAQVLDFDTLPPEVRTEGRVIGADKGDIDEDGFLDVVVTQAAAFQMELRLFFGDGSTALVRGPGFEARDCYLPAIADLDGDGHLDVFWTAVASDFLSGGVGSHLGNGRGDLAPVGTWPTEGNTWPFSFTLGDFDGDGDPDAIAFVFDEATFKSEIDLFPNDGNGAFGPSRRITKPPGSGLLNTAACGDFDGDGRLDLLMSSGFFMSGDGAGDFGPGIQVFPAQPDAAIGDVDGDAVLDVASRSGTSIAVRFGDGAGRFPAIANSELPFVARSVETADLDDDGCDDVIAVGSTSSSAAFFVTRGDPSRALAAAESFLAGPDPQQSLTGDFDGDGHGDVVTLNRVDPYSGASGSLTLADGGGTARPLGIRYALQSTFVADLRPLDFDRDGHMDFVASGHAGVDVVRGDGGGGFRLASTFLPGPAPSGVASEDLDGDGVPDLAVALMGSISDDGGISVLRGDGAGQFGPIGLYSVGARTREVAIGDFDGDAAPDLAAINEGTDSLGAEAALSVLRNDGTGLFEPPAIVSMGDGIRSVVVADFDGDGTPDLAATHSRTEYVSVFPSDGAGSFGPRVDVRVAFGGRSLAVVDLARDGTLDLVTSTSFDNRLYLLRNDGSGAFTADRSGFDAEVRLDDLTVAEIFSDGVDHVLALFPNNFGPCLLYSFPANGPAGALGPPTSFEWTTRSSAPLFALAAGDWDEDGDVDALATDSKAVRLLTNRTRELLECRRGNVNGAAGPVTDVLFVNGTTGTDPERIVTVDRSDPFEISVGAPPSRPLGPSPYVLYVDGGQPTRQSARTLPFLIGRTCMPTPLSGGSPPRIANNFGRTGLLGRENWPGPPTSPAPSVALRVSGGLMMHGGRSFFVQGLIVDTASRSRRLAVTNGVGVRVR